MCIRDRFLWYAAHQLADFRDGPVLLLMRRIPEELRRASVFKILFYHYYNFDLDQPFLPQYEQNNRSQMCIRDSVSPCGIQT